MSAINQEVYKFSSRSLRARGLKPDPSPLGLRPGTSRSLRARGLKPGISNSLMSISMSRSLRARGLKLSFSLRHKANQSVALFTGAWIETKSKTVLFAPFFMSRSLRARGLKHCPPAICCIMAASRSLRARGLKQITTFLIMCSVSVALFTGAWIETIRT